jgi:hypothetical protein
MYTQPLARTRDLRPSRSRSRYPLLFLSLICLVPGSGLPLAARAATIVAFDFEDASNTLELTPDSTAPGVVAGAWSDADGTLLGAAGNPGRAISTRSWLDGNTLSFALAPEPGLALSLGEFHFDQVASGSGPAAWSLRIDGAPVASGATTSVFTTHGGAIAAGPYASEVIVSLIGSGATGSLGTWRIDNFSLTGTVAPVPVPPPLLLLLSGIVGLVGMRVSAPV